MSLLPSFYLHFISSLPSLMNPWWSQNGRPHAHCQLRDGTEYDVAKREEDKTQRVNKTLELEDLHVIPLSMLTVQQLPSVFWSWSPVTQNHRTNVTGANSFHSRHHTKTSMRLHWLKQLLNPHFILSDALSNVKQPWLPVTQPNCSNWIISCWASTKYTLHKRKE